MKDKWDLRFKNIALEIGEWSKDPSCKVGCIAVRDRRVIATGYNGFPVGISDDKEDYDNREIKYDRIVHAEKNMIYNACRHGVSLVGATVYVSGLPVCGECSKGLVQCGIKRIVMPSIESSNSRWKESGTRGKELMIEAGIEVYEYNQYDIHYQRGLVNL